LRRRGAADDGLAAFADTLNVAAGWLETLWPHAFPLASDDDVMMRRNALSSFADSMAVVEGLRRLPLVRGRHGTVTLRDMDIASGTVAAGRRISGSTRRRLRRRFRI
jgi:hypothetical protein